MELKNLLDIIHMKVTEFNPFTGQFKKLTISMLYALRNGSIVIIRSAQ